MRDKHYYLESLERFGERRLLLLLFLAALVLRLVGINYGYFHADERVNDAAKVLAGQVIPGQHFYPPLLNYINAFFLAILYALGRLIPVWHNVAEFRAQYFSDPTAFYITCRFVSSLFSALTAPLFYLIGKSLGMQKRYCLLAGILGLLIPVMIYLAHLSKSDVHLAASAILVFYCLIEQFKNPASLQKNLLLGFAIALAVSFKHSYIFILLPLMLGHILALLREHGFTLSMRALAMSAAIMLPLWCVMNIGILLDFQNFIDFQKIQAHMSVRTSESFAAPFETWFALSVDAVYGVGPIVTLLFFAFPFYLNSRVSALPYRWLLNSFWLSVMVATIVVAMMSGTRQQSGLWLPYFASMHFFAAILLVDLLRTSAAARGRLPMTAGISVFAFTLLYSTYAITIIYKQALMPPLAGELASYVRDSYGESKILTSVNLRLPQDEEARVNDMLRHQRLAEKYQVTMPVSAREKLQLSKQNDVIYYRKMPEIMFGLENVSDADMEGIIKPYAWPPQLHEWELDTWLTKDFTVFIVASFHYYRHEAPQAYFRNFYTEIEARCEQVRYFEALKPAFTEYPVSVFDCSAAYYDLQSDLKQSA